MKNRTHDSRTKKTTKKFDPLNIEGKDKDFDYSFQTRKKIEESGGGLTYDGWEAITKSNHGNERWVGPKTMAHKNGAKQFIYQDTILCRRPAEDAIYYKQNDNEKRNRQIEFINGVSQGAQQTLKKLDPNADVKDTSTGYTQKNRPTEED